jgi:methylphosphotriester-DNA--protein-cysteine methyltransferase
MTKRKWTNTDLRTMKSMAGKQRARTVARKLRRTEGAVTQKAFTIGLSLDTR